MINNQLLTSPCSEQEYNGMAESLTWSLLRELNKYGESSVEEKMLTLHRCTLRKPVTMKPTGQKEQRKI